MFGYFAIVFAFVLGFALSRASTCTVAATTRWIMTGKIDWLLGIIIAVCWSAVTLIVLRVMLVDQIVPPSVVPINLTLFSASILMGVGAFLNGGCFIGSIGRISSGNLSFLMTFVGLAFARMIGDQSLLNETFEQSHYSNALVSNPIVYWGASAFFVGMFLYSSFRVFRKRQPAIIALCVMGIFAALTFVSDPDWSYEALIGRIVNGQGLSNNYQVELTVLALFSGAILSSALNGKFAFQAPKLTLMVLCFVGGTLMGVGAKFVPGGNDTLLLWTIPNFALHGFVSYITMVATVAMLVMVTAKFKVDIRKDETP